MNERRFIRAVQKWWSGRDAPSASFLREWRDEYIADYDAAPRPADFFHWHKEQTYGKRHV